MKLVVTVLAVAAVAFGAFTLACPAAPSCDPEGRVGFTEAYWSSEYDDQWVAVVEQDEEGGPSLDDLVGASIRPAGTRR